MANSVLVLRLAAPMQAWGSSSQNNRRETDLQPSKAGVIGLLAAAQGRRRTDPIEELTRLEFGVRVDQPGSLLRDYHTVSDLYGRPLLSANQTSRGTQKPTSPKKFTHITQRFYLQDACFVAAVRGDAPLIEALGEAVRHPSFPLALGRRSCPPTQPLLIEQGAGTLWEGSILHVLSCVPWQASTAERRRRGPDPLLPVTYDDLLGNEVVSDAPVSFEPLARAMLSRRVSTRWVRPEGTVGGVVGDTQTHDPFSLLGGA